jgi:hypothetical protein
MRAKIRNVFFALLGAAALVTATTPLALPMAKFPCEIRGFYGG